MINGTRPPSFKDFVLFLKMLEVYGSGYEYFDERSPSFTKRRSESQNENRDEVTDYGAKAVKGLKEVLQIIDYVDAKGAHY